MPRPTLNTAKVLRKRMTDTERLLWRRLRAHRFMGTKFKRQQPIGPYIVDFVCFQTKLVVEVDGGQHLNRESDRLRDAWLEQQGFRIFRFWNNEVLQEAPAVLERIAAAIRPLPHPSPTRGEG
ncbi:MAG TPA: DUF559 domain-containing protein [Gammaproteobacteria bacterium]|nr:DUF559 domain-containing protein [Gammaproteobacteria bacterium]